MKVRTQKTSKHVDKKFSEGLKKVIGITEEAREEIYYQSLKIAQMVPQLFEIVLQAMDDVQKNTPEKSMEQVDGLFKLYTIIRPYKAFFKHALIGKDA